ncbi:MAG: hypothetical protein IMY71_16050, partial [Bacteroidetes bacterium]|nr:hypothetical protein [Bacteroidota bacterium]
MDINEEKSSVREEQFGEEKNNPENTVKKEETSYQVKDAQIGEDPGSEFVNFSETITEKTDSEKNTTDSSLQEKSNDGNDSKQIKSDVDSIKAEEDPDETAGKEVKKAEEDSVKSE